jgi:hypothetical protein
MPDATYSIEVRTQLIDYKSSIEGISSGLNLLQVVAWEEEDNDSCSCRVLFPKLIFLFYILLLLFLLMMLRCWI